MEKATTQMKDYKKEVEWISTRVEKLCDEYGETPTLMATNTFHALIEADKMTTGLGHPKGKFYRDVVALMVEIGKRTK